MPPEDPDDFDRAIALHEAGRLLDAIPLYRAVLAREGEDAALLELLGGALLAADQLAEAEPLLSRSASLDPSSESVWIAWSLVLERLDRAADAVACLRRALEVHPTRATIEGRLGGLLARLGRSGEARPHLDRAIASDPRDADALGFRAMGHLGDGRLKDAEADLDRAIELDASSPILLSLLARLRSLQGRPRDALAAARRQMEADPASTESRSNLLTSLAATGEPAHAEEVLSMLDGAFDRDLPRSRALLLRARAQMTLGRVEEAIDSATASTSVDPRSAEAWVALASIARRVGLVAKAVESARAALAIRPGDASVLVELGRCLVQSGDAEGGVAVLEEAARVLPESAAVHQELSIAQSRRGLTWASLRSAEAALALDPALLAVESTRVRLLAELGRHEESTAAGRLIVDHPGADDVAVSGHLFNLNYGGSVEEREVVAEHRRLAGRWRIGDRAPDLCRDRDEERPLRIGFLSGDLRAHSVTWFLAPLISHLDRRRASIILASNGDAPDSWTTRLRENSEGWIEVAGRPDSVALAALRDAEFDVLIDLSGHTGGNRLPLLARRVAPIQATWLGYPNTTGVASIDYRLVDEVTDPVGSEGWASEALLRIRPPFLCYGPPIDDPTPTVPDDRPVVFGSFNNPAKLSDATIALWSRVLMACEGASLLLKSLQFEEEEFRRSCAARFARHGVAAERVVFQGWSRSTISHLHEYREVDVALDPFPYHGTTTTCEALWSGVPVVTRTGGVHRARVGTTLLQAVGLPELIAADDEAFVQIASRLAWDRPRRAILRTTLRDRMRASPLCDARGFAARFEEAIRHAWRRWCRGLPAVSSVVGGPTP